MRKKSFTLVEILISISLFSIIIVFLYKMLDNTTAYNNFYKKKLTIQQNYNNIKKVFFLDLANKISNDINITKTRDDSIVVQFKSTNNYHNPFYQNITYFVSKSKHLLRIESLNSFNKDKLTDEFFTQSYIDILDNNISDFYISKQKNNIKFYISNKTKTIIVGF